jgi:two-component system, chemotaxis family, response regulator Rcp1
MSQTNFKLIDILVIEDNPGDARLIAEAIKTYKILNSLSIVRDGEEAMDFLNKKGEFAGAPRPDLIFLDLNLPKMDGREVLAKIKLNDEFKQIPVVVMTISAAEEDIIKSYSLHANCYVTKPIDLDQFVKVVESIDDFWFSLVKLPAKG